MITSSIHYLVLYNLCYEPESKVHQMIRYQSGKYTFYFWNQFRILVYSNLQKSPHWKLNSPPKSGKSQNRLLGGDFAHVEDHCYRLKRYLPYRSPCRTAVCVATEALLWCVSFSNEIREKNYIAIKVRESLFIE